MPPTPLVLIHGNPETAVIWGPLIAALDRAGAVALSPPGFGVPAPRGFDSSTTTYRDWLASQLELFRAPVDQAYGPPVLRVRPVDGTRDESTQAAWAARTVMILVCQPTSI